MYALDVSISTVAEHLHINEEEAQQLLDDQWDEVAAEATEYIYNLLADCPNKVC